MELTFVIRLASPSFARGALVLLLATFTSIAAAQTPPFMAGTTEQAATGTARALTIDEAVALALEQNVALRVERMNPTVTELDLAQAYGTWLPAVTGSFRSFNLTNPPDSFLQTGELTPLTQEQMFGSAGIEQLLPTGGQYSVGYDATRNETNNIFQTLNPSTRGNFRFSFSQPLLRNRTIDTTRQQIIISRGSLAISEFDLRNTVVSTIRNVKNAYWDLVVAQSNLAVQQQTLDLSRQTLADNRKRVEVGTMAPIDIVQAEAEVAGNEELVIVAEQTVAQAQDRLRALILDPGAPQFWDTDFAPTDQPMLSPTPVDIDAAVSAAMANRLDLKRARTQLDNNAVRVRFLQNQVLPQINVNVDYSLAGLGGTVTQRQPGFPPGDIINTTNRPYTSVLRDIAGFDFPTWTIALQVRYPLGRNTDRVSLQRVQMQNDQSLLQLRDTERQVVQQVRDLGRQANTNLRRVSSTQAARALAEKRLEAEEKKFGVGLSTTFNVLQAQRDLANARNNEQRAILDYVKSLVDFEAAQEASIGGTGGVTVIGGAGGAATGAQGGQTQIGTGGQQFGGQQGGAQFR
jgi:outer membrane protein